MNVSRSNVRNDILKREIRSKLQSPKSVIYLSRWQAGRREVVAGWGVCVCDGALVIQIGIGGGISIGILYA